MKINVSEATNIQLNWLVAKCEGVVWEQGDLDAREYGPEPSSTNWIQGGDILAREKISTVWSHFQWCAGTGDIGEIYRKDDGNYFTGTGSTPLIAGLRCFVVSRLGSEVDIPEELV